MATATKKDFYEVLGLKRGASGAQVRQAYRRLARKYHPDVNPGDKAAEERFKEIQQAYEVLSDDRKRKLFDQFGTTAEAFQAGPGRGPAPGFDFSGFDFGDVPSGAGTTGGFGSTFRDVFSQVFSRGQPAQPEPGTDLEYHVDISFWESVRGCVRKMTIARMEKCAACGGSGSTGTPPPCTTCSGTGRTTQTTGHMRFEVPCTRCGGTGRVRIMCRSCNGEGHVQKTETLEVRIPAGVSTGSRVRVAGKGNAGARGGRPGDLYIISRVLPHPYFERLGEDVHSVVPITLTEAALGAKIEVPTIDGRAIVKIPPGTQSGQKFRLREKGAPSLKTGRRGDHIVEVRVSVPRVADERSKEILRELARLNPENPRASLFAASQSR